MENRTIVKFYPKNAAKNPDNVIEQAIGNYQNIFIIGWDNQGELDARADSNLTIAEIIYLLEAFKHQIYSEGEQQQ